jgi:hypothetical protein
MTFTGMIEGNTMPRSEDRYVPGLLPVRRRAQQVIFRIDSSSVSLEGADAFDRFDVIATANADLSQLGEVADDGQHVFVAPDTVRTLAGDAVSREWEDRFAEMVVYASSKGWVDARGSIRAHVARP